MSLILDASHPDFIVAAKPAGVSFHQDGETPGLVTQVRAELGEPDLHAVHRLDRITSGLVLFARGAEAAREFGTLFAGGKIAKTYLALSDRKPAKKQGWIKGVMLKGRGGDWRLARAGGEGTSAVTRFDSRAVEPGLRLFRLWPQTGRTHQLRVAMKSLSAPILGDARYGGSMADRGYLHAWRLEFTWQGQAQDFVLAPQEGKNFCTDSVVACLESFDDTQQPNERNT